MEKKKRVLSLGTVAMDVILETRELPKEDGFGFIDSERLLPGGSAANLSVALARYGIEVYQTGKIGDDKYGDEFRRTLVEDGVNDKFLITKSGGSTLHTFIITAPDGKHCIIANLGDSVLDLQPEELPEDILKEIDVFYTDMFSSRASIYLGRLAKEKGIPVVYNMQCTPSFMKTCGVTMEEIEEMISLSTVVSGGREGYFEMTGETDYHKGLEKFLEKYSVPQGVICTAGDEGALWHDAEESIYRDAYSVEAVDTTGAGDCFLAGFIYAYFCKEMDKQATIEFASASAALKCVQKGPRTGATVEDILQFIHSNK